MRRSSIAPRNVLSPASVAEREFRARGEVTRQIVVHDVAVERLSRAIELQPGRAAGTVVREADLVPVRDAQTLAGSDLDRARASRPCEPDRQLSSPLLNVDQREVVEGPLHAAAIGIELLERRDRLAAHSRPSTRRQA